jgi:lipoprotein-releasing system ATP-binding protein
MITARHIEKSYGNVKVLKGVNLDIKKGEIVAVVGRSGAGKSTLLHILGTLDKPDAGTYAINGIALNNMDAANIAAFRNKHIGFIFQFHHLLPEFTALENVTIPALIHGTSETAAQKRGKDLLDYLGLSHRLTHKPSELSGGEQQRVAVARALMNTPSVVLADEPTGNLDSASANDLHQLIFQLRKDFDQTFVIVTHNEDLALRSDRRLTMEDGIIK